MSAHETREPNRRYTHRCPLCAETPDVHCICDGVGALAADRADEWNAALAADEIEQFRAYPLEAPPATMPRPCVDCAFRTGSPEREDHSILRIAYGGSAFFCHQGMVLDAHGRYVPHETDERGRPVGHPLCAGWVAVQKRGAKRNEATP